MEKIHKIVGPLLVIAIISIPTLLYLYGETEQKENVTWLGFDEPGDFTGMFYVNVTLEPHIPIAGVQFDVLYNSSVLQYMAMLPGELFPNNSSYIWYGNVDNNSITGNAFVCLNREINQGGVICHLVFTVLQPGETTIELDNIIVGNKYGEAIESGIKNSLEVTVG